MDPFYQNLPQVYQTIEDKFNGWRNPNPTKIEERVMKTNTPINISEKVYDYQKIKLQSSRLALNLGEGYLLKCWCDRWVDNTCRVKILCPQISNRSAHIEEINESTLKKYGFTRENGFWVPKHKVVGLQLENGKIKVNPSGRGFTLTEDASENGTYQVKDIQPEMFQELQNGKEFEQSYQRHMFWLGWLYHHPEIYVSIRRHGTPENPREAISRMLLARIKDNAGEIFIGDLDNLVFDKA